MITDLSKFQDKTNTNCRRGNLCRVSPLDNTSVGSTSSTPPIGSTNSTPAIGSTSSTPGSPATDEDMRRHSVEQVELFNRRSLENVSIIIGHNCLQKHLFIQLIKTFNEMIFNVPKYN